MSRAIDDSEAVSTDLPGTFLRLATMFFVLGVTAGARADEPTPGFRVGQRVVWRSGEQTHDGGAVVLRDLGKNQVFQVERVEGKWLWLRAEGSDRGGWASADQIVAVGPPADPAVRRADARPQGGSGSVISAPFRHVRSGAALRPPMPQSTGTISTRRSPNVPRPSGSIPPGPAPTPIAAPRGV